MKTLKEHLNLNSLLIAAVGGLGVVLWSLAQETRADVKTLLNTAAAHETRLTSVEKTMEELSANTVSTGRFNDTMKALRLKIGDFDGFDGTPPPSATLRQGYGSNEFRN